MKRYLIIVFCCFCKIAIAQSDYQYWEQEALAKGASWSYYTRAATAPNYPTYTSLYINGRNIASFNDAGTCRSKITELKRLAEQMYTRNASSASTHPSQELYDMGKTLGKSKAEVDAEYKRIGEAINKGAKSSNAKKSQELVAKVDGVCSCQTVQNPNYNPNAKPYDNNNDLFKTTAGNKGDGDNQSNSLFGESTQYENIFDTPSARNTAAVINTNTIQPSVPLNFDDMGKYASGVVIDDTHGTPYVDYRPSGIILPDVKPIENTNDPDEKLKEKIKELEDKHMDDFTNCLKYNINSDCLGRFQPIRNQIEALKKKLEDAPIWREKGDEIIKANRAQYTESFSNNIPWQKMDSTIGNPQRLITVQNQLISLNSGTMPKYEGEWGKNEYYFKNEKTGAMFFIDKDGSRLFSAKYKTYGVVEAVEKSDVKLSGPGGIVSISKKSDDTYKVTGTGKLPDKKMTDIGKAESEIDISAEQNKANMLLDIKLKDAENKENDLKNMEFVKGEIKTKPVASLEISRTNILEDGAALKATITLESGNGNLGGKFGSQGAELAAEVELANGKATFSYVQAPTIELKKDNLKITQREIGVSFGAGFGVGGKAKAGPQGIKFEGAAGIKAGLGWEKYEANKNINYLPDNLINKVVSDYYSKE